MTITLSNDPDSFCQPLSASGVFSVKTMCVDLINSASVLRPFIEQADYEEQYVSTILGPVPLNLFQASSSWGKMGCVAAFSLKIDDHNLI